MNVLAIDTSGSHLTVLIKTQAGTTINYKKDAGLKHSVTLLTEVESALESAKLSLKDINVFCAVTGPGSFTGIRIGVSTVKAFAYAFNKKVLSVTSFDTIAYDSEEQKVLAVIDARHGNYYVCGYENKKVCLAPSFIDESELKRLESEYKIITLESADIKNGLVNAVNAKIKSATDDRESIVPLYVKKSQAEEEADDRKVD